MGRWLTGFGNLVRSLDRRERLFVGALFLVSLAAFVSGSGVLTTDVTVQATVLNGTDHREPAVTLRYLGESNPVELAAEKALVRNGTGTHETTAARLRNEGVPRGPFVLRHYGIRDKAVRISFERP